MILTEREKWLMQQAWKVSKDCDHELNTIDDWLNWDSGLNGANAEMLLAYDAPTSESIVKTVDPDNLPDEQIIIVNDGAVLIGRFFTNHKIFYHLFNGNPEKIHNDFTGAYYIEQKDLIKWFEDSK